MNHLFKIWLLSENTSRAKISKRTNFLFFSTEIRNSCCWWWSKTDIVCKLMSKIGAAAEAATASAAATSAAAAASVASVAAAKAASAAAAKAASGLFPGSSQRSPFRSKNRNKPSWSSLQQKIEVELKRARFFELWDLSVTGIKLEPCLGFS